MGKIIYIDGQSPASAGSSVIQMSQSDKAATRLFGMRSCLSPLGFFRQSGTLAARDVFSGGDCSIVGSVTVARSSVLNNQDAVALTESARLNMPAGSGNFESFSFVGAFEIASGDTTDAIILARYNAAGTRLADLVRYAPGAGNPGLYINPTATGVSGVTGGVIPVAQVAKGEPHVLSVSFNSVTGRLIARINGVEYINKTVPGSPSQDLGAYVSYGFPAPSGLLGSVARGYFYDSSLLDNVAGSVGVLQLESALMLEYGVS